MRGLPLLRAIWITSLLSIVLPAPARADWLLTPFFGVKFAGETSIVDLEQAAGQTTSTFGVSVARLGDGLFGAEAEFAYTPGYFDRDGLDFVSSNSVVDLSGNLILALPPDFTGGGLRPYFTVGLGLIHAEAVDFQLTFRVRRTMPAITLGTGATGLLTNRVGVRFDVRYLRSVAQEDEFVIGVGRQLSYWRGTIGIGIRY
jgi:opacity protein-like surface antigen